MACRCPQRGLGAPSASPLVQLGTVSALCRAGAVPSQAARKAQGSNLNQKTPTTQEGGLRLFSFVRHRLARCIVLGELVRETSTRYLYRRQSDFRIAFVPKRTRGVHIQPCETCHDYSAG